MVPPSRPENGYCIDRNVMRYGGLDMVTTVVNNQQGRPSREHEVSFPSSDNDGLLVPSLPAVAAFLQTENEELGCVGREMIDQVNDFGSSRAPASAQNGCIPPNTVPSLVKNENGFVGGSEKRLRTLESSPAGNHTFKGKGKESFPTGGGGGFQDCPEAPLRKRVHVEGMSPPDSSDGFPLRFGLGKMNGHVDSENGKPFTGFGSKTRWEGRTADSVPPAPVKTEGSSETPGETVGEEDEDRRRVGVGVVDVNMTPEEFVLQKNPLSHVENGDKASVLVDGNGHIGEPDVVDMDVDDPIIAEDYDGVRDGIDVGDEDGSPGAQEFDEELTNADWVVKDEEAVGSPPIYGHEFEEIQRRESSTGTSYNPFGAFDRPESSPPFPGGDERTQANIQRGVPSWKMPPEVVVIDVDDSDDDEKVEEVNVRLLDSDGSSTKGKKPIPYHRRPIGFRGSSGSSAPSLSPEDSDSDCRVLDAPPRGYGLNRQRAAIVVDEDDEDNDTSSEEEDSDSSDVEAVAGSQSEIKRKWEEAALRRRMGRTMRSAGSKANGGQGATINLEDERSESQGLEESVATSTYRESPDSKDQTETSEARGGPEGVVHMTDAPRGSSSRFNAGQRPAERYGTEGAIFTGVNGTDGVEMSAAPAHPGRQEVPSSSAGDQGDIYRPRPAGVNILNVHDLERKEALSGEARSEQRTEANSGIADLNGDDRSQSKGAVEEDGVEDGTTEKQDVDAVGDEAETLAVQEDLIAAREKLKQTDQYRKTDAAEWASRQQEIQRQALESKKLRQRKRQEADRKREMERKQKERIDELRQSQMKEERNSDLRDQLRGQVRTELERVAAACNDFASLLRQLGIPVEGGSHPSIPQVNAAYKKALFKFHPDRAVASSHGEPRYQVEAEEKFKLIQRLKDTLVPVANNDFLYSGYRSYF